MNFEFFDDAEKGRQQPVTFIDPGFGLNDDHPPHHPVLGQQFLASVYSALAASPHWKNLLLVVTYDENGGFFDHVPPPTAADERADLGFDQLGFRVPTLVAGPYVKQGYVSSEIYDHTSALKHIKNAFGLPPLTMRSEAALDLTDCIDLERLAAGNPSAPISLPEVDIDATMLPPECDGVSFRETPGGEHDHVILEWAALDRERSAPWDLTAERPDYIRAINDLLTSK
jgi:phospholipase C